MHCARPEDGSRMWRTADALHVDVRGLAPPATTTEILRLIDHGEVDSMIVAHFDCEPIFLYPELDDRGWDHEILTSSCGGSHCGDEVQLQIVRLAR